MPHANTPPPTNTHSPSPRARKVKCDEAKPHCRRCTSTARKCSGYPPPPSGQAAYTWTDLLTLPSTATTITPFLRRLPTTIHSTTEFEARAHAFFRAHVAPALATHSTPSFWRILVHQASAREPAVHHAVACISALYEDLLGAPANSLLLKEPRQRFALAQYNVALRHLTAPNADANVVLLVCLLFVCIEAMLGNKDMAIQHCRHGIMLFNEGGAMMETDWVREELGPIFLRLATMPYFFGVEAADFPEPVALVTDVEVLEVVPDGNEAAWDYLVNRTVRAIRKGYVFAQAAARGEPEEQSVVETYLTERRQVLDSLVKWRHYYLDFRTRNTWGREDEQLVTPLSREMECIVGYIWLSCSYPNIGQLVYDDHLAEFEAVLALSKQHIGLKKASKPNTTTTNPKFILEKGFLPSLYFVGIRCRRLDLRLVALQHILQIAHDRENLFDTRMLYSVGVRLAEMEHGVQLDLAWPEHPDAKAMALPAAEARIEAADITEERRSASDENGQTWEYQRVFFLVQPSAIVPGIMEWVKVRPSMDVLASSTEVSGQQSFV